MGKGAVLYARPTEIFSLAQGFVAFFVCCVTLASPVFAGLTSISAPPSSEKDQVQILSHTYGGTFVADGNDFTNGAIRAVRLDDSGGDSFFNSGIYSAQHPGPIRTEAAGLWLC